MTQRTSWWALSVLVLISSLLLFACGGGGGSSSSSSGNTTGSVAILVTDAPSDEFKAIEVTVTAVSLIGDDDSLIEIWSDGSGKTVDLLSLETEAQLFTLAADVPVGWYDKVRLHISNVTLVNFDDSTLAVEMPSQKIDLNPRGKFYVSADETLLIQLDMDANKSIHLVNPGHYRLRPVVFVDILTAEDMGRLVRLPGTVVSVGDNQFVLRHQTNEFLVHTDNDTLFFGPAGTPASFDGLTVDDEVIAFGHFRLGSEDDQPVFDAVLVAEGDYQKIRGALSIAPGSAGTSLTLLDGDGLAVAINLDDDTAFYDCFGHLIAKEELVVGQRVAVDAVMVDSDYHAALVIACPETVDALSGALQQIEATSLTVEGRCAEEAATAAYYLLGEDSLTEIIRSDLVVGETVLLFGTDPGAPACFNYDKLFMVQ